MILKQVVVLLTMYGIPVSCGNSGTQSEETGTAPATDSQTNEWTDSQTQTDEGYGTAEDTTSAAETPSDTETENDTGGDTQRRDTGSGTSEQPDSDTGGEPDSDSVSDSDSAPDSDTGEAPASDTDEPPDSETSTPPDSETDSEAETDSDSRQPDSESDLASDSDPVTDPDTDIGTETETETAPAESSPRSGNTKALVSIVDDSLSTANSDLNELYARFPDEVGGALAELYDQPISEITSRSLSEIAEDFGEDWIVADIEAVADGNYDDYTTLTDEQATFDNFISAIEAYSNQGYVVDILINLHGSPSGDIIFHDDAYPVEILTERIQSKNLNLSVVYQTVCYGSTMLDEWTSINIHAVNGSIGENIYVNFAPGAFLEKWTLGTNYDEAVQQARTEDMTELRDRLNAAAANNFQLRMFLMAVNFEAQSEQVIDGEYPQIKW